MRWYTFVLTALAMTSAGCGLGRQRLARNGADAEPFINIPSQSTVSKPPSAQAGAVSQQQFSAQPRAGARFEPVSHTPGYRPSGQTFSPQQNTAVTPNVIPAAAPIRYTAPVR